MAYLEAAMAALSAANSIIENNKEEEYRDFVKQKLLTIIHNTEEILSEIKVIKILIEELPVRALILNKKAAIAGGIDLMYQLTRLENGKVIVNEGFEDQFKDVMISILGSCNELRQFSFAAYPIIFAGIQAIRFGILYRGVSDVHRHSLLSNIRDVYLPWYLDLLSPDVRGSFGSLLVQAEIYKRDVPYVDSLRQAGIGGWMRIGVYPHVEDRGRGGGGRFLGGPIAVALGATAVPMGGGPINNWSGWFDGNFETGFAMTAFELRHDPYPEIYGYQSVATNSDHAARTYGHHISGEISSKISKSFWYKSNIDEINMHVKMISEIVDVMRRVFPHGLLVLL